MREIDTFIKLYRKFTEWEWYSDISTSRLFLHLILTVNWTDKKWQGICIERGSRVASYQVLSTETGLSVKQVRTAIKKLQSTGEVAIKSTNKYSVFTVKNYDLYQAKGKQEAGERQAEDKQRATTKESKEVKKEKNNNIKRFTPPTHEQVSTYCKERKNTVDAERFLDFYKSKGWMVGKNKMKDWKAAVRNWERSSKQGTQPIKKSQNQFHNFEERDYDYDELEKQLFERQMGG
nr:MAG TPA: replisome organizer [Caudoviricetes sp.]